MINKIIIIAALLCPSTACACRCRQQPLASYFNAADLVFIGKVKRLTKAENSVTALLSASSEIFKGDESKKELLIKTPLSSATCGVDFELDQTYLIFANKTQTNTCQGTRKFSPLLPDESASFIDVSATNISKSLYNLFIQEKINQNGIGGVPKHDSLVGLLKIQLKDDYHTFTDKLLLYNSPTTSGNTQTTIERIDELESLEIGYEEPAVIVYEQNNEWFRVKSKKQGYLWARADSPKREYFELSKVLLNRLNYVTDLWDRLLWPEAGAGIPTFLNLESQKTDAVEVTETKMVANSLWLKIKMYSADPCVADETKFDHTGWIPAWNSKGELNCWFWSRGC